MRMNEMWIVGGNILLYLYIICCICDLRSVQWENRMPLIKLKQKKCVGIGVSNGV